MAPTTPKKMNRLKLAQAVELVEFLKSVCKAIPDTPFCEYLSPWDDQKVAEKLDVTAANVRGARQAILGKLKPAPATTGVAYTDEDKQLLWDLAEWATSKGFIKRTAG